MGKLICHNCKKTIRLKEKYHLYPINTTDHPQKEYIKCLKCFDKDPVLRNWKICEVYDRIVSYIRPVSKFNPGKVKERKDRKNFKLNEKKTKKTKDKTKEIRAKS